jgi:hypothetical protein
MRFSTLLTLAVSALPLGLAAPTPQEGVEAPLEAEQILEAAKLQAVAEAEAAGYNATLPVSSVDDLAKRTISISACTILEIAFRDRTYFPGSSEYEAENTS